MWVTEKEAAEMWCPFVRHSSDTTPAAPSNNRFGRDDGVSSNAWNKCVGTKCMAWRRGLLTADKGPKGYCGLMSMPE